MAARELRTLRDFLDRCGPLVLLGHEMVKADSAWSLPVDPEARRFAAEALATRLRFGQVHPGDLHLPMAARWFEFHDIEGGGTRCLIRMVDGPSPHLRASSRPTSGPIRAARGQRWPSVVEPQSRGDRTLCMDRS